MIDIHCSLEIRLLLLPRLRNSIRGHRSEQERRRVLDDNCCDPCHHLDPHAGWYFYKTREQARNVCDYCKHVPDLT